MKKGLKLFFFSFLLVFIGSFANGQENRLEIQQQVDSMQRLLLMDSLKMSDETITQLFAIRDSFFRQSNAIYADGTLSDSAQQNQIRTLREQTVVAIKNLLGDLVYKQYMDLIESRMKRQKRPGQLPLSLDGM